EGGLAAVEIDRASSRAQHAEHPGIDDDRLGRDRHGDPERQREGQPELLAEHLAESTCGGGFHAITNPHCSCTARCVPRRFALSETLRVAASPPDERASVPCPVAYGSAGAKALRNTIFITLDVLLWSGVTSSSPSLDAKRPRGPAT